MVRNFLLSYFVSISVCFFSSTVVAHEAIIGGFPALGHRFLYQVSVQIHGHVHVCGGGIISDRFVLSAAHCVLNRTRHLRNTQIFILAGTNNLNETRPPALTIQVEKVFFPKEFHPAVAFNYGDIAVLKLVDSLKLEHHSNLAKLKLSENYDYHGDLVIASFGCNKYDSKHGRTESQLQFAEASMYYEGECENFYPLGAIQPDRHFCAKTQTQISLRRPNGVCFGDSGSPFVGSETIVIGILSKIPSHCDEEREPAIYTRVAYYTRMIVGIMEHDYHPDMIERHA